MALETGTYISDLVSTNPVSNDPKSAGDDHIRLLKKTILASFPAVTGAVTSSHTELNLLDGKTDVATAADIAAAAFTTVLPAQTGNSGKFITTNGSAASWSYASIVGASNTIAQFNTACSDADFAVLAANTFTGAQTFPASGVNLTGSSTGVTTFASANASASNYTITFPAGTDTAAVLSAQTFTGAQGFPASGIKLAGSSTGVTTFASANSSATNYVATFQAKNATVAMTDDYPDASSGVTGYMTGTYATKLDGIAAGATNVTNTNQLTNGAGFLTVMATTYGAIGTYVIASIYLGPNTTQGIDSTVAASVLYDMNNPADDSARGSILSGDGATSGVALMSVGGSYTSLGLSGTWRVMTRASSKYAVGSGTSAWVAALFLRIS